jgi:hypothetical protein
MGVTLVARTPVAVLTTPCPEHPRAQTLPGPRAVQGVVAAAVRLPGVLGAATAGSARDDAADRAELHGSRRTFARRDAGVLAPRLTLVTLDCRPFDITRIVSRGHAAVYSATVLRLRDQSWASGERIAQGDSRLGTTSRPAAHPLGADPLPMCHELGSHHSGGHSRCLRRPAVRGVPKHDPVRMGYLALAHSYRVAQPYRSGGSAVVEGIVPNLHQPPGSAGVQRAAGSPAWSVGPAI